MPNEQPDVSIEENDTTISASVSLQRHDHTYEFRKNGDGKLEPITHTRDETTHRLDQTAIPAYIANAIKSQTGYTIEN